VWNLSNRLQDSTSQNTTAVITSYFTSLFLVSLNIRFIYCTCISPLTSGNTTCPLPLHIHLTSFCHTCVHISSFLTKHICQNTTHSTFTFLSYSILHASGPRWAILQNEILEWTEVWVSIPNNAQIPHMISETTYYTNYISILHHQFQWLQSLRLGSVWPLACWDCGNESLWGKEVCLLWALCIVR